MTQIGTILGALVASVAFILFTGMLFSLPVWLLWNYCLVGAVAGVSQISWLQAWGLMILCAFLFKSSSNKS